MQQVAAYWSLALTMLLVLTRPRLSSLTRIGPAHAGLVGVGLMATFGLIGVEEVRHALVTLWRPFIAVASVMVMTKASAVVGVLTWLASAIERAGNGSAKRFFAAAFAIGAVAAGVLNNDAAVLLLTPVVLEAARRSFPGETEIRRVAGFAVFACAGVAPLVVSNPMNIVVASYGGIDFNAYAVRMIPIALGSTLFTFMLLRLAFRRILARTSTSPAQTAARRPLDRRAVTLLLILAGTLVAYPVVAAYGGSIWSVALVGGLASVLLIHLGQPGAWPAKLNESFLVVRHGVAWEILIFLFCALTIAHGLENAGVVHGLAAMLQGKGLFTTGAVCAVGSAIVNNHPMSHLCMMALDEAGLKSQGHVLAVMIGGDLGPRLLPPGSLAGMLWIDSMRKHGIEVSSLEFIRIGALITIPTLFLALGLLALITSFGGG